MLVNCGNCAFQENDLHVSICLRLEHCFQQISELVCHIARILHNNYNIASKQKQMEVTFITTLDSHDSFLFLRDNNNIFVVVKFYSF